VTLDTKTYYFRLQGLGRPGSVVGIATGYGLDGPGIGGPGSVVGIATGYGLDGPGIGGPGSVVGYTDWLRAGR